MTRLFAKLICKVNALLKEQIGAYSTQEVGSFSFVDDKAGMPYFKKKDSWKRFLKARGSLHIAAKDTAKKSSVKELYDSSMPRKIVQLKEGTMLNRRWKVVDSIGYGGYCSIYMVKDGSSKLEAAAKIEEVTVKPTLQTEVVILLKLKGAPHALQYLDYGETDQFRFLIMELGGPSLSDLKRFQPTKRFSLSTVLRLGVQFIEAVHDLHRIGYVHRDIKPCNFVIGREVENQRLVYLIDFGIARRYARQHDGRLKRPRKHVGFRGTLKYASPNIHDGKEAGRRDDLWSVLYAMVDLRYGSLPWHNEGDKARVGHWKKNINPVDLLRDFPDEIYEIMETLKCLQYEDKPDYDSFIDKIRKAMGRLDIKENELYDWQSKKLLDDKEKTACCFLFR